MLLIFLYYAALSVSCSLVFTCCKRAGLLALLCVMFFFYVFINFPYGVSGQVWYLILLIHDLCLLLYLEFPLVQVFSVSIYECALTQVIFITHL